MDIERFNIYTWKNTLFDKESKIIVISTNITNKLSPMVTCVKYKDDEDFKNNYHFNVANIDRNKLIKKIGVLSTEKQKELKGLLKEYFSFIIK